MVGDQQPRAASDGFEVTGRLVQDRPSLSEHTTAEDTVANIDFAALARITVGMYGSILELTSVPES